MPTNSHSFQCDQQSLMHLYCFLIILAGFLFPLSRCSAFTLISSLICFSSLAYDNTAKVNSTTRKEFGCLKEKDTGQSPFLCYLPSFSRRRAHGFHVCITCLASVSLFYSRICIPSICVVLLFRQCNLPSARRNLLFFTTAPASAFSDSFTSYRPARALKVHNDAH